MNLILACPFEIRLAVLFLLGTCVGSLANLAIYRLAWHRRSISPWWPADPKAPPRRPADRIPIVGWLGLRRETELHGSGFWIRPLLLELLAGLGFAALYWWEIGRQGLLPSDAPTFAQPGIQAILHAQFTAHLVLISLMLVASVIDADEKTIPDAITVPGALLGLLLATAWPWSLLPDLVAPLDARQRPRYWSQVSVETWEILQPTSPASPPPEWIFPLFPSRPWAPQGIKTFPQASSLAAGLGCWWLWCVGLMPRAWYSRYGRRRAFQFFVAKLLRESATYRILLMGLIGSAAAAAVWLHGGPGWTGLFGGLLGMAAGGGLVWLVRIIGTTVLRREAMGFGDVTLMAMIGSFLGWQNGPVILFFAVLIALGAGSLQWLLHREHQIFFGPFLAMAAVITIVGWAAIWDRTWLYFEIGWLVPSAIVGCVVGMPVILGLMQLVKRMLPPASWLS